MVVVRVKSNELSRWGAVDRYRADPAHVAVAVHVTQVRHVHGVLGRFLGMAGEPDGPESRLAPVGAGRRILGKTPLRRPATTPPPGEHQTEDFACVEHPELRRLGSGGKGRSDASTGCIVLETVKRTDQMAVAHAAPGGGSQFGTQVRTRRLGHADAPFPVAPDDDLLAHPGPLNQPFPLYGPAGCNEVPTLGKRGKRGDVVTLGATGLHDSGAHCGGSAPVGGAVPFVANFGPCGHDCRMAASDFNRRPSAGLRPTRARMRPGRSFPILSGWTNAWKTSVRAA